MNLPQEIILKSEEDTKKFANDFAFSLKGDELIILKGDLGAGKTFFARQIIKFFCGMDTNVTSPTFNILQTYKAKNFTIYHYDLYRLRDGNELYELALEEAMQNNICLIEWPEIAMDILRLPMIEISLQAELDTDTRICKVKAY